ncbi:formylglycine-generating enzyme family protein [Motiliproteus sp. SC1-56]|uniref:formylglycine-generating enzyme family protein n=1 Tax=Motiliproteus sp. SC1-56 TaxID=2799565 RepID=UPI001A8F74D7
MTVALISATATATADDQPGFADMAFTRVDAGCFLMGHNQVEAPPPGQVVEGPRSDEYPQHQVCVDVFDLGTYEVTQQEWYAVMGGPKPTHPQRPVANISREQIGYFLEKLNSLQSESRYRLPTEAEWEYACRAGGHDEGTNFHDMARRDRLMEVAWYRRPVRPDATPEPVGSKLPNAWGLYDMLGNVWEHTADSYVSDAYATHAENNPVTQSPTDKYVIRGGSYKSEHFQVRCGSRVYSLSDDPLPTVGFRLVKQIP